MAQKTLRRYTAAEDQIILNCVKSSFNTSIGIKIASKKIDRSETSIMQRYYYIQKNNIKTVSSPATIRVVDTDKKITEKKVDGELKSMSLNIKGVEITMVFK